MKKLLNKLLLILLISPFFINGQVLTDDMALYDLSTSVWGKGGFAVDYYGNTYTSMSEGGLITFMNSSVQGPGEGHVFKHDSQGNLEWLISGGNNASVNDIKISVTNSVYITGYQDYDFFPNSFDSTNVYGNTDFVAKINSDGTFEWVFKMPGRAKIESLPNGNLAFALRVDPTNNSAPFLGDSLLTGYQGRTVYGEISENGDMLWFDLSQSLMDPVSMASRTIHNLYYNNNKLYLTGYYDGTYDFGQNSLVLDQECSTSNHMEREMYLASIDLNTNEYDTVVKTTNLRIVDLDFDNQNNIYYMVEPTNNCNVSSPSTEFLGQSFPPPPNKDVFIVKSDENFNFVQWRDLGGTSISGSADLYPGEILIAGEKVFAYFYNEDYGDISIPDMSNTVYFPSQHSFLVSCNLDLEYIYHTFFESGGFATGWSDENFQLDAKGDKAALLAFAFDYGGYGNEFLINHFKVDANLITGRAYKDFNQNQIFDTTDQAISGSGIEITPDPYLIVTNMDGTYEAFVDTGSYYLNISNIPNYYSQVPSTDTVIFTTVDSTANVDLRLEPIPGAHDVSIDIVPAEQMTVGNVATHKLIVTNNGTFHEDVNVFFSPLSYSEPFSSVDISPSMSINGNYYVTTLMDMNPGESRVFTIDYTVPVDFLNIIGETSTTEAEASIIDTDAIPQDNYVILSDVPVAPYDPNIKIVNEPVQIDVNNLDNIEWINYTVYFQNEGNAPAVDVRIEDIIDSNLVLSTIKIIDASDSLYATVNQRKVTFHFDSIMLPSKDVDEEGSKGYVSFKLKRTPGLSLGDSINNIADIYFDFNPAIITNTTLNEVVSFVGYESIEKQNSDFVIFPNPASSYLTIQNLPESNLTIKLIDLNGKIYLSERTGGSQEFTLTIDKLTSGTYLLKVGDSTNKIVIK